MQSFKNHTSENSNTKKGTNKHTQSQANTHVYKNIYHSKHISTKHERGNTEIHTADRQTDAYTHVQTHNHYI